MVLGRGGGARTGAEALVSLRRSCGDGVLVDGGCGGPGIWQAKRCGELHGKLHAAGCGLVVLGRGGGARTGPEALVSL